ncbi:MAG: tetratricopeptide repeat protein, partial [Kofleriaceae bacterium]
MRQPSSVLRYLVILFALMFTARAYADDRGDARTHYQAGVKFYSGGDYRAAIREFSAAQQLVPADLNNYNLALCYDKLGDAEPAIQYYRAFLDRQPNTDKRAEIEASVNRLEAASRSVANK